MAEPLGPLTWPRLHAGSLLRPGPPVRRLDLDSLAGFRMDPPVLGPQAREDKCVNLAVFDHAEAQVAIERCGRYRLPIEHFARMEQAARARFEICQNSPSAFAKAAFAKNRDPRGCVSRRLSEGLARLGGALCHRALAATGAAFSRLGAPCVFGI